MQTEEWRPIAGYEGWYEVSSLGRVRSLPHVVKNRYSTALRQGRVLRQTPDKRGYLLVHLCRENETSTKKVHRLVAATFISDPPTPKAEVNHIDFDKTRNVPANLEWCDRDANHRHAINGQRFEGTTSPARGKKLTADIVRKIREVNRVEGIGSRKIGRRFGISHQTAQKILSRHIWINA